MGRSRLGHAFHAPRHGWLCRPVSSFNHHTAWLHYWQGLEFIFAGALTYTVLPAGKAPQWNFYVAAVFVVARGWS